MAERSGRGEGGGRPGTPIVGALPRQQGEPPLPPLATPASGRRQQGEPPPPPLASQAAGSVGGGTQPDSGAFAADAAAGGNEMKPDAVVVKIAEVGDSGVGKTSLMVRWVERRWDPDYSETLGVQFSEKRINLPNSSVILSLWDLGGDRTFSSMLPM